MDFSSESEKTVEIESEFDFSEVDSDQPAEPRKDPDPEEDTLFTKTLYNGAKLTVFDSFLLIVQFALR